MRKKFMAQRFISLFLSALLLLGDGSALTAAASSQPPLAGGEALSECETAEAAAIRREEENVFPQEEGATAADSQENIPGKAFALGGTLSGNDPCVSDSADSDGATETPGNDSADSDSAGPDGVPAVSGNDPALTVSGGDAAGLVRLPERLYEEERPETYGTLVSYDEYSRTYHVEGNRYVTVVGNDGATYVDDDGSLRPVDNTLVREDASLFGLNHMEDTGDTTRANDY